MEENEMVKRTKDVKQMDFCLKKADEVDVKEPEWLIPWYIPKYGITTIAGEGGVGKTSIWCSIVADVTTGKQSFLVKSEVPDFKNNPQNVVVFSAEDSWEYVLKKRLEVNGADMSRILFMDTADDRFVDLNFDSELLEGIISAYKPALVVFDPIQAFVPPNLKMGDRNAMRKCFAPLMGFGEKYGTTSIVIVHANKQSGVYGRKRIADSSDIWDASRSVLMTGITSESNTRYISHEKSNWGKLKDTVLFSLENSVPTFKCYTKKKDRDFVQEDSRQHTIKPVVEDAKEIVIDILREHKQMEVSELDVLVQACGISKNALKNAKAELKKEKRSKTWSVGYGDTKKFYISLMDTENINE